MLLVGGLKFLDQQRHAVRPTGEDRAASGFQDLCLRQIGRPDLVVEIPGRGCKALGQMALGGEDATFGHRRADFLGLDRQRMPQRGHGRRAADVAQGHRGGRGHGGIGILQPRDQAIDRLRVAANPQRIDHADQEPAVQLAGGRPQGVVGRGVGDDFQGDAGPGGKFRAGEQRRQGRHGLAVADDRQPLAGQGLFGRRGVTAKHRDEFLLLVGRIGLGGLIGGVGLCVQGEDECQEWKVLR